MATGLSWFWLALVIIAFDISSKQFIIMHLWLSESVQIMPFINLVYSQNPGVAFSVMAANVGYQRCVCSVISALIIVSLLIIMYRSEKRLILSNIAYSIITGGAIGNLFDRIVHSFIIDFVVLYVGDWYWPTFNVADVGIFIGTVLKVFYWHDINNKLEQEQYLL